MGEPESMPKLTPTIESTVAPDVAKFDPEKLTTGAWQIGAQASYKWHILTHHL